MEYFDWERDSHAEDKEGELEEKGNRHGEGAWKSASGSAGEAGKADSIRQQGQERSGSRSHPRSGEQQGEPQQHQEADMSDPDLVIWGGHVLDPLQGIDGIYDVLVRDGKILRVGEHLVGGEFQYTAGTQHNVRVVDAQGKYVVPGLIDLHTHLYDAATPLGITPDLYCLSRGVTTAVDAGSAGAGTLRGLKKYIIDKSKTRVLALLNIAMQGLSWSGMAGGAKGGELDNLNQVSVHEAVRVARQHPEFVVGIKVRLTADIADDGRTEEEAFNRAILAAKTTHLPLMTHHAISSVGLSQCPGTMRAGDIYTHTYHGWKSTIVSAHEEDGPAEHLHPAVVAARERGVVFDVGHGAGAFSWTAAERATSLGFWPDVISTDLHVISCQGPAYDLVSVMTKFLHLGMPFEDIIRSVTHTPAKTIGWDDRIGTFAPGASGDITLLEISDVDVQLEDCHKQTRRVKKRIVPTAVYRAGASFPIHLPPVWPNPNSGRAEDLETLWVKDSNWRDILANDQCCMPPTKRAKDSDADT